MSHKQTITPLIIPIFIPHEGCPHRCLFCNQNPITGAEPTEPIIQTNDVRLEIDKWLTRSPRRNREVQIAFYGGSFTALPIERQQELLETVQPYLKSGQIDYIRLSTRPDCIDENTVQFLWDYGVRVVELGIQSMNNEVLTASKRGHTVEQSIKALKILTASDLKVVAQLMLGLPKETTVTTLQGVKYLASLKPDFARLYPALVIRGSGLATLFNQNKFRPLSLNRTIILAAKIKKILAKNNIKIIRLGLPPSTELKDSIISGPYHPALGELVAARIFFKQVKNILMNRSAAQKRLIIAARDRSIFYGQKKYNLQRLEHLGLLAGIDIFFDDEKPRGTIILAETDH